MEKLWPASENQSYTSFFLYKYLTACVNDQFLSSFLLRLSNLFDDGAFLLGNYLQPNHINHPLACLLYTDIIPLSQHQSYFFQCPIRAFPQLVCLLKNAGLATNQNLSKLFYECASTNIFHIPKWPQTKWNPRKGTIFWCSFLCPCSWCGLFCSEC